MNYDSFVGVDPGTNGAIVVLDDFDPGVPEIIYTDDPTKDVVFRLVDVLGELPIVLVEEVHSMPKQGVVSTWTFARNVGQIEGIFNALFIYPEYVRPRVWQEYFGLLKKEGESKTDKKNRHKEVAQRLFPGVKVTHRNADALLIAEYCRRIYG